MTHEGNRTVYESSPPAKKVKIYFSNDSSSDDDTCWMMHINQVEASQLVKAIYDNTVNALKECSDRMAVGRQRLPDSHPLEIEAVTMAIRAHGLTYSDADQIPPNGAGTSTSSTFECTCGHYQPDRNEISDRDKVLSEALTVVIQNKGLGSMASCSN